jgi:ferredoxin
MFNTIYPAQQTEPFDAVFGRFSEELGELAEAVRVVDAVPQYFISEAADVFAWLMHLANLIDVKEDTYLVREDELAVPNPITDGCTAIEFALYREYPDRCVECGRPVCACPPILPRTLGRLAHEGPQSDELFLRTNDMAARFNIGDAQVEVEAERIVVTADVVTAIYHCLTAILESLQQGQYTSPHVVPLTAAAREVLALAIAQRVSQRSLNNFLKLVLYVVGDDRRRLENIIMRQPASSFRDAFLRYLGAALASGG